MNLVSATGIGAVWPRGLLVFMYGWVVRPLISATVMAIPSYAHKVVAGKLAS